VRITTATLAEREAPEVAHLIAATEHTGRSRSECCPQLAAVEN
jgi:hypothetical protein